MNLDEQHNQIPRGWLFIFKTQPHYWEDYIFWCLGQPESTYIPVRLPDPPPSPDPQPEPIKIYPQEDPMEDIGYTHRSHRKNKYQ